MQIRFVRNNDCGAFVVEQDLFPLDSEGYSAIPPEGIEVPPGREGYARKGVEACPVLALRTEDESVE